MQPGFALIAGILGLIALYVCDYHTDVDGKQDGQKIGAVIMLCAAAYSLGTCATAYYMFKIPISTSIALFGEGRIALIFYALTIDYIIRIRNHFY